jgi:hypothetical protein
VNYIEEGLTAIKWILGISLGIQVVGVALLAVIMVMFCIAFSERHE